MESKYSNGRVISSLLWKLMEQGGMQVIQFAIQIVLARLLAPHQFGTIAIVMVFIKLAQVFIQNSFNMALIQKKNADDLDFSSIFFLSIGVSIAFYLIIYNLAPLISNFYEDSILVPVLRILSIILLFGSINMVQNTYLVKHLRFKKLFKSSLSSMLISGIMGIIAAYNGLGIWALVIQQLINQILLTLFMWFTVKWRPCLRFSFTRVRGLFSFGWKFLASSLLNNFFMNVRTLIIGRFFSAATLGFYNRGEQIPNLLVYNIDGSIQSVMFSTLSAHQDDRKRIREMMRRTIVSSTFLIFPMMIGLAAVAENLVIVLLTEKWLRAIPFLQIFCFSYALMPIQTTNLQAMNSIGRSDIFLKLELIKKIFEITILLVSLPFGVFAIALGQLASSTIATFINAYPNKALFNYGYIEQIRDITPSFLISVLMGLVVYSINYFNVGNLLMLAIQVLVGIILYLILAIVFRIESFNYLYQTCNKYFNDKFREKIKSILNK